MFIDVPAKPIEKHGEFPFELVYEYKGEQYIIKDTIVCDYDGYSWSLDGGNSRDWTCEFNNDDEYGQYIIDTINGRDLYIDVPEAPYIYPYFFLNLDELGVGGVIKWIGIYLWYL